MREAVPHGDCDQDQMSRVHHSLQRGLAPLPAGIEVSCSEQIQTTPREAGPNR